MKRSRFTIMLLMTAAFAHAQQRITIDVNKKAQVIDNIGSSGAWFSEGIGSYWPSAIREQMARWLFSKGFKKDGSPEGIGLSSWRFNIGGGTAEQGDSSGIKDFRKRVECFLRPDGTYDWSKQAGYLWFTKKAKEYGVETLIAFSNTPPVWMNQNGLGYKTEKDHRSNLRVDRYDAYASFLANVYQHFDKEGLHFDYISPVNEPQWDWSHPYGDADQEGTAWTNSEVVRIAGALDTALNRVHANTKILLTEAGHLEALYGQEGTASHQIQALKSAGVYRLSHVPAIIGGHSYFTDKGDSSRRAIRMHVSDTAFKYGLQYWQTEYSMLADGYKDGHEGPRTAMDCALFLAKVMHDDFVYGNAAAWQFWNSWEPGRADMDTRYYLVALHPKDRAYKDGTVTAVKNLWALGQYSRFVRPGMQRVMAESGDAELLVSAFVSKQQVVLVCVNYGEKAKVVRAEVKGKKVGKVKYYQTDKDEDMVFHGVHSGNEQIELKGRSVVTVVME
ncbi:glycoside hydrolase [Chitinophaga sp.]|uniref:glycoside hydrolase n=1 Tax=Chitinophaga sp. TaxID=1869181 RepID=UPI0031CFCE25